MASERPTLHHLDDSQSQQILWLLEELEIPYNLKLYERGKSGPDKSRAPDSLKEIHPLGKSPQLVTKDGQVITERSAIAMYLIRAYDNEGRLKGDNKGDLWIMENNSNPSFSNDEIRDEQLTSFGNASLNPIVVVVMVFDMLRLAAPFFLRPVFSALYSMVHTAFLKKELQTMFAHLDRELAEEEYFMGSSPGRADFILMWHVDFCAQRKYVDLEQFPKTKAWWARCQAREGWKRALNKGNGYDLTRLNP